MKYDERFEIRSELMNTERFETFLNFAHLILLNTLNERLQNYWLSERSFQICYCRKTTGRSLKYVYMFKGLLSIFIFLFYERFHIEYLVKFLIKNILFLDCSLVFSVRNIRMRKKCK